MTGNRIAYRADESFYDAELGGYLLAEITENEAGYLPVCGYPKLADAEAEAARKNTANGLTIDDVLTIITSSMRKGPVR